jgi:ADP-ribosylglycohydrolase
MSESRSDHISEVLIDCVREIRSNTLDPILRCVLTNDDVRNKSIFEDLAAHSNDIKIALSKLSELEGNCPLDRAVGSLCGLCIADAIGHNFEFLPICDRVDTSGSYFEYPSRIPGGTIHKPLNQFQLQAGQWTDDASMSLCMADSLLSCGQLNGSDLRCWFWNWWNNGVNNAFRHDSSRVQSVGLGGNISSSLYDVKRLAKAGQPIPHRYQARTEDAGNGSLMRLAPVPIRYHCDIEQAREVARASSFTTHPGRIAAESCAFLAHVIVRAMHRPDDTSLTAALFLDQCVSEYLDIIDAQAKPHTLASRYLRRLLIGEEMEGSSELCWNWKNPELRLEQTVRNRGLR